jgi:hypothetical protein
MKQGLTLLAAVCFGAGFGACVRGVVVNDAHAQAAGTRQYKVVGASFGAGGYEEDLNKMSAEGWRYVGAIPIQNQSHLVFER